MEENKNDEILKSMEVLREVNGLLAKAEDVVDKNVDNMDSAIAALIGISVHGFVAKIIEIIERRLKKDELFNQLKAKRIADAENSGLSMN